MSDPEVQQAVAMWIRYAQEDLELAAANLADRRGRPRHVCFGAQQAAEKALKAVLVARQRRFPFTHDLDELASLVDTDDAVTSASQELAWLSRWAVQVRYPGTEEADWADAEAAVREACLVVEAARTDVRRAS